MKMTNWLCAVGMMGLVACGGTVAGVTQKASDAATSATTATCNLYDKCGYIGSGKTYETKDACTTKENSNWTGRWPAGSCDNKISSTALSACTDAISKITCGSYADVFTTVNDQCAQAKVCSGS